MLQLNFDPFPVLETSRLILREVATTDVNEIFFLRSDAEVLKYIKKEKAQTEADALDFIEKLTNWKNSKEAITWAIVLKGYEKIIGTICLWNIVQQHQRAELGYALHPYYHRKGIMKETIKAVLKYGFDEMKLHSVEARLNAENIPSSKLLESCNFINEANFKEDYYYDGVFYSTKVYSLLNA